jgi:hypothetical protein
MVVIVRGGEGREEKKKRSAWRLVRVEHMVNDRAEPGMRSTRGLSCNKREYYK